MPIEMAGAAHGQATPGGKAALAAMKPEPGALAAVLDWYNPQRPDLVMGILLGDTTALIRRLFDRRVRHLGFTRAQWKVAGQLAVKDGQSQTELADLADIERAPMGKLLDRMELAGWIARADDPQDRRIRRVFRTAKLEAILPALSQVGEALMADILKDISKEDLRAVVESLGRIKASLVAMDNEIGIGQFQES